MKCAHHYSVIKQALDHHITNHEGAKQLGISLRHFIRLKNKVKNSGPKVLIHANCGRKPPNAFPQKVKNLVLNLYKPTTANLTSATLGICSSKNTNSL